MGDIEIIRIIVVAAMAMGGLTIVSALARRISGPYGRRARLGAGILGVNGPLLGVGSGVSQAEHDELKDELVRLRSELDAVHERLAGLDEIQNRLDFTERVIGQMKNKPALPEHP